MKTMEPTEDQKVLFLLLRHAGIQNKEIAALLSILDEREIDYILNQGEILLKENGRTPTQQELMEIMWPILMNKPQD